MKCHQIEKIMPNMNKKNDDLIFRHPFLDVFEVSKKAGKMNNSKCRMNFRHAI